jgi:Uma2 family endonuclease
MSLREYVLVSTREVGLDVYQRNEAGQWVFTAYEAGDVVQLETVEGSFAIEELYENIVFATES